MDKTALRFMIHSMPPSHLPMRFRAPAVLPRALVCAAMLATATASESAAQSAGGIPTITRDSAFALALAHGSRAAIASATARSASARVRAAGALTNPLLTASYSKSVPQYHAILDIPLDFLTLRGLRVASARSASEAAELRLAFERAAIRLDVDTSYTIAAARRARAALSLRNAADAESLLTVASVRRSAGDASDLDVDVASINAGRARNVAATDSAEAIAAILDLQQALGMAVSAQSIAIADSLTVPTIDSAALMGSARTPATLPVAAAQRDLQSADQALALEHRSIWSGLALQAGVEDHDPTGSEPGLLPTFGVSVPLPLFSQGQGAVAVAEAERDRARVQLAAAQRESAALVAKARRDLAASSRRAARDRELVETANRVARRSLQAYAEGAYPLTTVLEAQRNARDTLSELIDDLVAANAAAATLRLYTATLTTSETVTP
jgi:cobalt-zinc-cadmium efflux system outer membrane protein